MPGTFGYTESTNRVVVTGGTSGSPATFADFVTADRAGTDTVLLDAASPSSAVALTYAIRPVEDLAILVKCVVANKTAEADFIFITGTDWRGAAQTESIDIIAGNGSYTSTKYWASITTLDCSDNAAGGGTVWADGDLTVTQDVWGVIWDLGHRQYQIDCRFIIGNDSTATHFSSTNESVHFTDVVYTFGAATLYMGAASNTYSKDGSRWSIAGTATSTFTTSSATVYIYGSIIYRSGNANLTFGGGDVTIKDSLLCMDDKTNEITFASALTTCDLNNVYCATADRLKFQIAATMDDIHIENSTDGLLVADVDITVENLNVTNASDYDVYSYRGNTILKDPKFHVTSPKIVNAPAETNWIKETYTCNIHVADKDGDNLASALIDCEYAHLVEGSDNKTYKCIADHTAVDVDHKPITGSAWATYWELYSDTENFVKPSWETGFAYKSATQEFAQQTTDANGDMTEQDVQYKKWVGTTEYEEARLHKFTLSKAGYETLVKDNITVDGPIDWHLEMQGAVGMGVQKQWR